MTLEQKFNRAVWRWRKDTLRYKFHFRRYAHPAYQSIFDMAKGHEMVVVRLILKELEVRPDQWFRALWLLTAGTNASIGAKTFEEAVENWLVWGKRHATIKQATYKRKVKAAFDRNLEAAGPSTGPLDHRR